jgi:hypothetical protein
MVQVRKTPPKSAEDSKRSESSVRELFEGEMRRQITAGVCQGVCIWTKMVEVELGRSSCHAPKSTVVEDHLRGQVEGDTWRYWGHLPIDWKSSNYDTVPLQSIGSLTMDRTESEVVRNKVHWFVWVRSVRQASALQNTNLKIQRIFLDVKRSFRLPF